jgi:protein-L-isoaspartate(D-aspartate) O-methyltransferase
VIHVGAAASIIPEALIDQLAEGGKMVIPVGGDYEYQTFLEINKIEGKIVKKNICSVRYVPLTDLKKQV